MCLQRNQATRRGSHRGLPAFSIPQRAPRLALDSGSAVSEALPGWTVSFPRTGLLLPGT